MKIIAILEVPDGEDCATRKGLCKQYDNCPFDIKKHEYNGEKLPQCKSRSVEALKKEIKNILIDSWAVKSTTQKELLDYFDRQADKVINIIQDDKAEGSKDE